MSSAAPSQWGRPIDSYTSSYNLGQKVPGGSVSVDSEIEGLQAMQTIIKECNRQGQGELWNTIDLSVLESALQLAEDVDTMGHLANIPLVGSCIRLMRKIKPNGTISPLSYEYGYLSFRLMVNTINICLLERSGGLDSAKFKCVKTPTRSTVDLVSDIVAWTVQRKLGPYSGQIDCDSVLGWTAVPQPGQKPPILSQFEASALLNILWADRKHFLRVIASTEMPGLSGTIFIISRLISRPRDRRARSGAL